MFRVIAREDYSTGAAILAVAALVYVAAYVLLVRPLVRAERAARDSRSDG